MSNHILLAMWDSHGLEYIVDVTQAEHDLTWATLQNKRPESRLPNLMHLMLRARYNSQRHYEIYSFSVEDDITVEDMRKFFETDPQAAADAVRRVGHCHHSDRVQEEQIKIR